MRPSATATDLWRGWYFEELEVGQRFDCGRITVTESQIAESCQLTGDFNPLHTDDVFAAESRYGRRIAPGILTAGLVLAPVGRIMGRASETHFEDHIRYLLPVYAGDTLSIEIEVLAREPRSKFGVVRYRHRGLNQDQRCVIEIETVMGHRYRPAGPNDG